MSDKASSLAGAKEEGLQQGLQQGLYQGSIQGKLEIILNMAKNQLDEETISKLTGISLEEIKEMKKQIKDN